MQASTRNKISVPAILRIPSEILLSISRYLSVEEQWKLGATCKALRSTSICNCCDQYPCLRDIEYDLWVLSMRELEDNYEDNSQPQNSDETYWDDELGYEFD